MKITEFITEKELKEIALNEYRRKIVFCRLIDEKMKKTRHELWRVWKEKYCKGERLLLGCGKRCNRMGTCFRIFKDACWKD